LAILIASLFLPLLTFFFLIFLPFLYCFLASSNTLLFYSTTQYAVLSVTCFYRIPVVLCRDMGERLETFRLREVH
jgi:hypothetical protein